MGDDVHEVKLDSWKAIAEFLNATVRTVQRWEATEGMPVHRRTHLKRASVWAFESELVKWLEERQDLKATTLETLPAALVPEEVPAAAIPGHKISLRRLRWLVPGIIGSAVCVIILWAVRTPTPSKRPVSLDRLFARGTQEGGQFERIIVWVRHRFTWQSPLTAVNFM